MLEISIALVIIVAMILWAWNKWLDRIHPVKPNTDIERFEKIEREIATIKLMLGNKRS